MIRGFVGQRCIIRGVPVETHYHFLERPQQPHCGLPPPPPGTCSSAFAPTDAHRDRDPQAAGERGAWELRQLQREVLPHAVLALLPAVREAVVPFLGYFRDVGPPGPGCHGRTGPRVGLVHVAWGTDLISMEFHHPLSQATTSQRFKQVVQCMCTPAAQSWPVIVHHMW